MHNLLQYIPQFVAAGATLPSINQETGNRINSVGDTLEAYVKGVIADTLNETNDQEVIRKDNKAFSWLGNKNQIPDLILKGGDAIEVKKVESINAKDLQLNSSPPKSKLFSNDTRIAQGARDCEGMGGWDEKNAYYAVGVCPKESKAISDLLFVDGECYAADKSIYQSIVDKISIATRDAEGVVFHETNELANIRKVDPLGITRLRVRGMWLIDSPYKVFNSFVKITKGKFNLGFIAKIEKFQALPPALQTQIKECASYLEVDIRDPNNPAHIIKSVYISYER